MCILLLLVIDTGQASILVALVWQEEIEEAGMMYLLLVWTLFNYAITIIPVLRSFVIDGRHSTTPWKQRAHGAPGPADGAPGPADPSCTT